MVKASVSLGHPTFAYVRPLLKPNINSNANPPKLGLLKEYEALGVTIIHGELDEYGKLVAALCHVDVVISTLAVPQHLDQLKIIQAMKDAGNIKRFVPSECSGYADGVKGYRLWDPTARKVLISMDVVFVEDKSTKNKNKLSVQFHKFNCQLGREENQLGTQSTSWREMSHTVY
ncbi:isoeugenol synthase 1-like [Carya illinoinensis]|uniref:isoeugenol synthase 1-like n=1 Tax=Carya illinoinensis TaxID=32201 RepID=UPI001C7224FF|nr:isoeugenol synthase 1-like [Carya illinoinensis]